MTKTYTDPKTVLSPKTAIRDLEVLFDGEDGSFSIAKMTWHGNSDVYGIRWNGFTEGDGSINKGAPVSTGHPVWFILPYRVTQCLDFEKIIAGGDLQSLILKEIIDAVNLNRVEKPDDFSLSVTYERVNIPDTIISDIKSVLQSQSIILVSYKSEYDYTTFNIAYS